MRIALGLPSRIVGASAELMLEWATRADRGPFSSLVVTDRVVSQALEPLRCSRSPPEQQSVCVL